MQYVDKKMPPKQKSLPDLLSKTPKVDSTQGFEEQSKHLQPSGGLDESLKPRTGSSPLQKDKNSKSPRETKDQKPKVESTPDPQKGSSKTAPKDNLPRKEPPLELQEQPEKEEDKDIGKVVETAKSMEGGLSHKQNAGGARDALVDENSPEQMNCWDAVIYLCAKSGELEKQVVIDTARRSEESEKEFNETEEMKGVNSNIEKYSNQFNAIDAQLEKLEKESSALTKKCQRVKDRAGKYFFKTRGGKKKLVREIQSELENLKQQKELLGLRRQDIMQKKTTLVQFRWKALMEARNRPYKDLLKVDSAWPIMTTQKQKNGKPLVTPVEGKFPPPAGCTILFTHDNSSCPDFDHVMLSLGGGKAAHLQSVTPTNLGLNGLDTGKLKVVDLMEYITMAAENSETWTVKAAPPCWRR